MRMASDQTRLTEESLDASLTTFLCYRHACLASIIEEPIEFNRTVIDHLERGQLLHEINGYGIVTPSFNEFVHKKFKHFVVGNYGPVEEDEKVDQDRDIKQISAASRPFCLSERVMLEKAHLYTPLLTICTVLNASLISVLQSSLRITFTILMMK